MSARGQTVPRCIRSTLARRVPLFCGGVHDLGQACAIFRRYLVNRWARVVQCPECEPKMSRGRGAEVVCGCGCSVVVELTGRGGDAHLGVGQH